MAKILVVDDDRDVQDLLGDVLTLAGHEVRMTATAEQCLAQLEEGPADVVVTDILMPGMGGLGLIRELRKAPGGPGIIAISGGDRKGGLMFLSVAKTYERVRTLSKPFRSAEVLALVDELLPVV